MDGWMDGGRMDGRWMDEGLNVGMTDDRMLSEMNNGRMDGWMGRRMDGWTERWMGRKLFGKVGDVRAQAACEHANRGVPRAVDRPTWS